MGISIPFLSGGPFSLYLSPIHNGLTRFHRAWRLGCLLLKWSRTPLVIKNEEGRTISNELQDLPIAADERPDRRKGAGNRGGRLAASAQPAPKGGSVLVWLLVIGLMGVAAFQYWQVTEMKSVLGQTRTELKAAKKVLSNVTGEISATGESLNKNESAIRAELETVNSEIRKLWDVSNKRNKKDIQENEVRIGKLEKKTEQVSGRADKATASVGDIKSKVTELNKIIKTMSSEQLAVSSEVSASLERVGQQMEQLKLLTSEQKKLETQQADAEKSLDSFRVQVNRQLLQLETSLREIKKPAEPGLTFQQ